eukprot:CAMPEP_0170613480 /NCGR_PEP_ID=MMETSP0224-20130122/24297_1 /TAXON_ID=285029 /ORGANISM="Togula jolla, Strain CCCM 725" /LENGTH=716 /DNA_ID=CAMNT_0010939089 /DNA_START=1 /DNA_END=2151 /DNA_ORIENTATION=-
MSREAFPEILASITGSLQSISGAVDDLGRLHREEVVFHTEALRVENERLQTVISELSKPFSWKTPRDNNVRYHPQQPHDADDASTGEQEYRTPRLTNSSQAETELAQLPFRGRPREPWATPRLDTGQLNAFIEKERDMSYMRSATSFKSRSTWAGRIWRSRTSASLGFSVKRYVLHPVCRTRLVWDVLMLLFITHDLLMVPFQAFSLDRSPGILALELLCTLFWTADMAVSFMTGAWNGPQLEMRINKIALHYCRTWFPFDFVVNTVEWVAVLAEHSGGYSVARSTAFIMIRHSRLVRGVKWRQRMKALTDRSNSALARFCFSVFNMGSSLLWAVHFIACLWYWIGDRLHNGWARSEEFRDADVQTYYFYAARWTVAQICLRTDIEMRTAAEYGFTVVVGMFGLVCVSAIITTATATVSEFDRENRDNKVVRRQMLEMLHRHNVSSELTRALKWYYQHIHSHRVNAAKEQDMLLHLPKDLLMRLLNEMRSPVMTKHILFSDLKRDVPRLVFRLVGAIVEHVFSHEGEVVFTTGDLCNKMYFVVDGNVDYFYGATSDLQRTVVKEKTDRSTVTLTEKAKKGSMPAIQLFSVAASVRGYSMTPRPSEKMEQMTGGVSVTQGWLCEAALWAIWENQGLCQSTASTVLMLLDATEFAEAAFLYEDAIPRVLLYARRFLQMLNDCSSFSDVMDTAKGYLDMLIPPPWQDELRDHGGEVLAP